MVTRKDVAALAGVSVTAVSRVVNNNGYVVKEKRDAIRKAVKKLGYRPSPVAVSLQQKATRQILFFSKDLGNAFNIELYRGMVQYAGQSGYMAVLSGTWDIDRIRTMLIDGVILPNETTAVEYLRAAGNTLPMPTVSASYGSSVVHPERIPLVEADTYTAMEMLLEHLLDKGHRRIALASPYPMTAVHPRSMAYKAKMQSILGENLDRYIFVVNDTPDSFVTVEEHYFSYGERIAEQIHKSGLGITAVACFNDDLAMGVLHYFQRAGVRIPEDISVGSIDGLSMGSCLLPRLTTVDLSPFQQGRECARVLLELLADKKVKTRTAIPLQIIPGGTVGPPQSVY